MTSIAQLDAMMKTRERLKHHHSKLALTTDDTKILGRNTEMKVDKVRESQKFGTNKMKTHNSCWTPKVNKASNEQIFLERRDLVSHWFDLWSDSQRKKFFDLIFRQCTRRQFKYIQNWFEEKVPLQHQDFTTVLPRFLSLYVFSFLEPKSLSRCAQVCWHWNFLAGQDVIWMQKCLKYGWFLPYSPSQYEFGCWKRHYIGCVQTLDYVVANDGMYGMRSNGAMMSPRKKEKGELSGVESNKMLTSRPPWVGPDYHPKELQKNMYAFLHDYNPNDPQMPKSAMLFHNRWGILKKKSNVTTEPSMELGLTTQRRRERHRALTSGEDYDLMQTGRSMTLSESMKEDLFNLREQRVNELDNTGWYPPNRTCARRSNLAGGRGSYGTTLRDMSKTSLVGTEHPQNPRVIFISSRVPASELVLDAVLFGVIPIVYEYEGTTAESLCVRLENVLQGREAQSIGIFTHSIEPDEIRLVHGCNVSMDTLDYPDSRYFFENVSRHLVQSSMGGQFDVFTPLAASETGMELMVQLTSLTGRQFSSPTGIIGNYNHINTDWCIPYLEGSPPSMYFCSSKLNVWANTADQAVEAINRCNTILKPYFDNTHKDIAKQLAGELMFNTLGQTDIRGVKDVTTTIAEGLHSLGYQNNVDPLEYLGRFLLEKAGVEDLEFTSTRQRVPPVTSEESEEEGEEEEEEEEQTGDETLKQTQKPLTTDWDDSEIESGTVKDKGTEKGTKKARSDRKQLVQNAQMMSMKFGTLRDTGKLERLTVQKYSDHPEKRTPIAEEIVASENEYNRVLTAIKNVYFKPLNAALRSNRAIISNQNIQIIFTDVLAILGYSSELKDSLQNRLLEWDPQQSCLGDIFVKFCTHLKVYTNFVNNYEVILRCIERSKEQTPAFRAFLERVDRTAQTKMLTLQEMLLQVPRRINQYVTLLKWFECHTPKSHQDRGDLEDAITTLTELDRCIRECEKRMERDRDLIELQRKILNCPALLEANRYLICQQDAHQLNPPKKSSEIPELQVFQFAAVYGLFLFNDALVLTRRVSKHFPFSRAIEYVYKFVASISLNRLRIHDLPDAKNLKNAVKMENPKQQWYFALDSADEKLDWITVVEQSIRAALEG